jgi:deoxycytidine triphosphate deaminase
MSDQLGVLGPDEIKTLITESFSQSSVLGTSYDARIGTIIAREKDAVVEKSDHFVLQPQGVAEVISLETLNVPLNVVGFASVKTSLCDDGIMALNIGLLDPGWNGKVSTTLVNFSNRPFLLAKDKPMLRLTFFHCQSVAKRSDLERKEGDYLNTKRQKILGFSDSFLNLGSAIEKATSPVFWRYAGIAGALLASFAFLVNLGLAFAGRNFWSTADVKATVSADVKATVSRALQENQAREDARFKDLQRELSIIQAQLVAVPATAPSANVKSPVPRKGTP